MKKFILFTFIFITFTSMAYSQVGQYLIDTLTFVRPYAKDAYTAGDLVADSGDHSRYFYFSNVGGRENSRGKIINVTVLMDTSNATNATVKLRFFTVSDSTGLWAQHCADNAAFQSIFQSHAGAFILLGDVAITLTAYGTAGGGATGIEGSATATIPYRLLDDAGLLYCDVIATGAFVPKRYGIVKVIVGVERQY